MASYIRINTAEDFNAATPAEGFVLLFVDTSSGKPVLLVKDSTGAVNEISGSGGSGSGIQPGVITNVYEDASDSVFARPVDTVTGMYSGGSVPGTLGYWPDPISNAAAPFGAPSSAEPTLEEWPWDVTPTKSSSSDHVSVFYGPHESGITETEFNNGDSVTYGNNVGFVSPWFYCLYMKPESLAAGYNPTSVTIEGSVDSSVWSAFDWTIPGSTTSNPLDASNYFDTVVYGIDGTSSVDLKCIKLRFPVSSSTGTMNSNVRNSYRYFRLTFGTDRSDGIIKLALISAAARR